MKFLQSGWVICLIGCATYLGCTLAFMNPKNIVPAQAKEHSDSEEQKPVPVLTGPSWEFNNPEVDQIIAELRTEKARLHRNVPARAAQPANLVDARAATGAGGAVPAHWPGNNLFAPTNG